MIDDLSAWSDPYLTTSDSGGLPSALASSPPNGVNARLAETLQARGYELLGELGRGGMGIVYLARNVRLNRPCALKTFSAGGGGPTAAARLRAEAEAVAQLRHPNVVQIYSVGEVAGLPFLELEYLPGGSLADAPDGTPRPATEAARLMEPVARAVAEAHRLGIVHRDLKPSNVLLTADGEPKVSDFGLARSLASDVRLTHTGQLVGTPCYMSPEQAEAGAVEVGPASDVYSLGAILYELLTGHPPFRAVTTLQTLDQVRSRDPVPPRRIQPTVPRDLETICLKCLHKDAGRRYPGAEALADDLARFLNGLPILARPTGSAERAWKWARRHPAVAVLSSALMMTVSLALVLVSWQWRRAESTAAAEALAHAEARHARREALRGQAELAMDHGRALAEQGEIGQGMVWLSRSLRLAAEAGDVDLDRAARINLAEWSARLSRPLARLRLPVPAHALAFRPDGRTLIVQGDDGAMRFWDTETWREAKPPCRAKARAAESDLAGPVAFDPSALPPQGMAVSSLSVSSDGDRFATGTEGGTVRVWDSTTLRQTGPTFKLDGMVRCLAFTPDGRALAVGLDDGTIPIWEVPRAGPIASRRFGEGPIRAVAFCRDGKHLMAVGGQGPKRWDLGRPDAPACPVPGGVHRCVPRVADGENAKVAVTAVSPDERLIATAMATDPGELPGSRIVLLDAQTGAIVRKGPGEPQVLTGIAFSPDSRRFLTWGRRPGTGSLREIDRLAQARSLLGSLGVAIRHAAFSPDGTTLLLGCRDGTARLWDVARDVEVHSPVQPRHAYPITSVAFDPRSPRIVTGCHAGTVRLWDRVSGALLHDVRGNAGEVTALAFSPDGTILVTAGLDATARFWDVASGRQLGPPLHHTDAVLCVTFHRDGRLVATGTRDGSAWLWPVPAAPMEGDLAQIARMVEERARPGSDER
jgi:WD40 repeat protein